MLSYQHRYHAGNFADVIKHIALSRTILYMIKKDKPIFYLDTHSGCGLYDLNDQYAEKTGEHRQGISLLWQTKKNLSPIFNPYLQLIKTLNPNNNLKYYPGSTQLAIHLFRPQDRLFCCELHPREFEQLQNTPQQGKRVFFAHCDGFEALNAQLPPKEKRGLIFIDPSFEIKSDYKTIPRIVASALNHFSTGTFCIWYPIVDQYLSQQLVRGLKAISGNKTLGVEFSLSKKKIAGMSGCGLWFINPPYILAEEMEIACQHLCQLFNPGESSYLIERPV